MRLALVGLGGIGASVGLAWQPQEPGDLVIGYDIQPDTVEAALQAGAIHQSAASVAACAEAELILIATPPHAVPAILQQLAPALRPETVITDVVSVKRPVLAWAQQYLPYPHRFVGGHPIAGTERRGFAAARADLFRGAQWVLTPTDTTDADAIERVASLVRRLDAEPVLMDAAHHDHEFALLSFLPHCLAFSLAALHRAHPTQLRGGGSWQSATRVAQSDPNLWTELLRLNREPTLYWLEALMHQLEAFRTALQHDPEEPLRQLLR